MASLASQIIVDSISSGKIGDEVTLIDAFNSLGQINDTNNTYISNLNLIAGSTGISSSLASFGSFYMEMASKFDDSLDLRAKINLLQKGGIALSAVGGGANILLFANDVNKNGLNATNTSSALNATSGVFAISAAAAAFIFAPEAFLLIGGLDAISVGFTALGLARGSGESATLGNDFTTIIEKINSLLPNNPTPEQKLQLAETIDAMFNRTATQFSIPVTDSYGNITGFRLETPVATTDLGQGNIHYEFSNGVVLDQKQSYSYIDPQTNHEVIVLAPIGGYNNIWSIGDLKIKFDDYGNTSISKVDSSGRVLEQFMHVDNYQESYTATITYAGQTVIQRVGGTVAGQKIDATFTADSNGDLQISSVDLINGQPPVDAAAALAAMQTAGLTSDILSDGTSDAALAHKIGDAAAVYDVSNNLTWQNVIDGFSNFQNYINNSDTANEINTYGPLVIDSLSLIKAIQTGQPMSIASSGLRLANDLTHHSYTILDGSSSAVSGILSIMSLDAALKQGDGWAIATSSAYSIAYAAKAYASFASGSSAEFAADISNKLFGTGSIQ